MTICNILQNFVY